MTTEPKPGDLCIHVVAEIEKPCKWWTVTSTGKYDLSCVDGKIQGDGLEYFNDSRNHASSFLSERYPDFRKRKPDDDKCPQCHGTGKRTVTLAGYVDAFQFAPWDRRGTLYYFITQIGLPEVMTKLTKALQNGTCPEEIKQQLEEVTNEH